MISIMVVNDCEHLYISGNALVSVSPPLRGLCFFFFFETFVFFITRFFIFVFFQVPNLFYPKN